MKEEKKNCFAIQEHGLLSKMEKEARQIVRRCKIWGKEQNLHLYFEFYLTVSLSTKILQCMFSICPTMKLGTIAENTR